MDETSAPVCMGFFLLTNIYHKTGRGICQQKIRKPRNCPETAGPHPQISWILAATASGSASPLTVTEAAARYNGSRRSISSRTASAYEQVDDHEHPYEHTAPSDSPGRRGAFPLAANDRPRPSGATPRCPFPSMRLFYRFVGRASSSIALYAPAAYENVPSSGSHVMPKRRA